jgi:ATP-dependent DNA helicase RecG
MTATPIPRSLALTLYGDLDVSLIRTKPKGRIAIKTRVVIGEERGDAFATITREVASGHRAFIVCPLIDESDVLGVKAATEEAKRLASGPLRGLRIGLLHGRMNAADKDGVMQSFAEGLLDVLVSTTVVEVGVDVPEATVMLVEAAERFGLAQLHQLRGRVGRSTYPSFCFLASDAEDDGTISSPIRRLRVLEQTNDGFVVAEEDLKRRGSGNLLGFEQAGRGIFKVGRPSDIDLMLLAKETAMTLIADDPDLTAHPAIRERAERIRETSHQE